MRTTHSLPTSDEAFAAAFDEVAAEAARVTYPSPTRWLPWIKSKWRGDEKFREAAAMHAQTHIAAHWRTFGRLPTQLWLASKLRVELRQREATAGWFWLFLFAARLLVLLAPLFGETPNGQGE